MNERIQELAEQADKWSAEEYHQLFLANESPDGQKLFREKFAELIVLEMCNVLDKAQWNIGRDWICDDGTRIIPKVKEHFGVE